MTPNQIIDEVWKLSAGEVFKVAFFDDLIFFCKIWPLPVALIISSIIVIWATNQKG